jgi:hypothetical protein
MFPQTKLGHAPALRPDAGKTWRGVTTPARNFGHEAAPGQALVRWRADASALVWGDAGTRVTPHQWAAMAPAQRAGLLALVPPASRAAVAGALAGGDRARALAPRRPAGLALGEDAAFGRRLRQAARQATREHLGTSAACYDTANRTARLAGGRDLDGGTRDVLAGRGRPLAHLAASAEAGTLRPGMAVYMNLAPGTNPRSLDDATRPHWATYLGRDADGTLRFADQYRADWSLAELAQAYSPRLIDLYADPFAGRR